MNVFFVNFNQQQPNTRNAVVEQLFLYLTIIIFNLYGKSYLSKQMSYKSCVDFNFGIIQFAYDNKVMGNTNRVYRVGLWS